MDLTNSPSSNLSLVLPSTSTATAAANPHQPDDPASNSNANSLTLRFIDDRGFSNGTLPESSADCEDDAADGEDGGDGADVEEFRILGHCIKRKRDTESTSSSLTNHIRSCSDEGDLKARSAVVRSWGNQTLRVADPDVFEIVKKEKGRQFRCIELIASANFVCKAAMEALGSHLTNKYSEGMPGARYYGGNQFVNEIENLCHKRALTAFDLSPENWGINVHPYSCTSANFAVFTGLLLPGDRVMGLDTISGGNTSHGCYIMQDGRKVSVTSIFFESFPYKINP